MIPKIFNKPLTQDRLNQICKKYGVKGVILQNDAFDIQHFSGLDPVIWFNKITKKSKKFIDYITKWYDYQIIVDDHYITEDGKYLEFYLEKLKYYDRRGGFLRWSPSDNVPKYERDYEFKETVHNEQGYAYAPIEKHFLLHLKDNSIYIEPSPLNENFGTFASMEFDLLGYRNHFHVKVLCDTIYDAEGYGDYVILNKLTQENIFIKKPTSEVFDYHCYKWISLKEANKDDLYKAFNFDCYLASLSLKKFNLLKLYDGHVPNGIDENSEYVSHFANLHGYIRASVPDVVFAKMMHSVEFYDSQYDYYGFLSIRNGREIFIEKPNDVETVKISSKNIEVYQKDDKLVTFSFIKFDDCLFDDDDD